MRKKYTFEKLIDNYEEQVFSEITEKWKKEYLGEPCEVQHIALNGLIDVKFEDGQVWCVEREQLK